MSHYNYRGTPEEFSTRWRVGERKKIFPYPGDPATNISHVVVAESGQEGIGIYPAIDAAPAPDQYYTPDQSSPILTFEGTEYQVGAAVRESFTYTSLSADEILSRKNNEGEGYAQQILFSSAQTQDNPNVYIVTDEIQRARINNVSNFLADRLKDRTIGTDSALGYRPGTDPDPTTYWARDVKVRLVNANNGNLLIVESNEVEWGRVIKTVGLFDEDIASALDAYRIDISAAYDAYVADPTEANRTALTTKDPKDPAYGWPNYYNGPLSARVRVL